MGLAHPAGSMIMVEDFKPPTVALTSPSAGATVSGLVKIAASAWDDVKVEFVSFHVNGALLGSVREGPFHLMWNSTACPNGPATITVYSVDSSGNQSLASSRQVTVLNLPGADATPKSPFHRK